MKKFSIIALAAIMVVAFSMPAAALENTFGGYWNTRFNTIDDTDGLGGADPDDENAQVASRLRLYYTAGINDNLKIVTKFEIDYGWGDAATTATGVGGNTIVQGGIGDVGADGKASIEVKNIYADFNLGPVNTKMGTQGLTIGRGMLIDDDISGLVVAYANDMVTVPVIWSKFYEGGVGNAEDGDVDLYALAPTFKLGEGISIQAILAKATTDDASQYDATLAANYEIDALYYGIDASAAFGPLSVYGVAILQGGEIGVAGADADLSGMAIDLGVAYDFGMFSLNAEYMLLSGDDGTDATEQDAWTTFGGESLNKGEIMMNNGVFWGMTSAAGPGSAPSGGFGYELFSFGGAVKPMDKLTIAPQVFIASRAETPAGTAEDWGTEIDLRVTYELVEGLNMDTVIAHWSVDDAVAATNTEDITMLGVQFSVSW